MGRNNYTPRGRKLRHAQPPARMNLSLFSTDSLNALRQVAEEVGSPHTAELAAEVRNRRRRERNRSA